MYGAAGHAIMPSSLSARGALPGRRESGRRWLLRHAAVVWLLAVQPVSLALTLDRALPRIAWFGVTAWLLVAARIALTGGGIAIARRLRAHEPGAWRAVALWAGGAIVVTLLERAWPVWPTSLAPSEARLAALVAVVRDAALVLVALWLARADTAVGVNDAPPRDST
jgi:hypothetical protein